MVIVGNDTVLKFPHNLCLNVYSSNEVYIFAGNPYGYIAKYDSMKRANEVLKEITTAYVRGEKTYELPAE